MASAVDVSLSKTPSFSGKQKAVEDIIPGICRECSDYMCFKHQKKVHINRSQLSLSGSQLSLICTTEDDVEVCKQHKVRIKFYCETHDEVGCGECMVLDHHPCEPRYIEDVVKNYNAEKDFKSIAGRVECLDKEVKDKKDEIQINMQRNKEMIYDVIDKIQTFRRELSSYLDKVEKEAISEVKQIGTENLTNLSKLEKDMKGADLKLEDVKHSITTEEQQSAVALFISRVKAKAKLREVVQAADNVKTCNVVETLKFSRDKKLAKLCDSRRKLGNMVRESSEMSGDVGQRQQQQQQKQQQQQQQRQQQEQQFQQQQQQQWQQEKQEQKLRQQQMLQQKEQQQQQQQQQQRQQQEEQEQQLLQKKKQQQEEQEQQLLQQQKQQQKEQQLKQQQKQQQQHQHEQQLQQLLQQQQHQQEEHEQEIEQLLNQLQQQQQQRLRQLERSKTEVTSFVVMPIQQRITRRAKSSTSPRFRHQRCFSEW